VLKLSSVILFAELRGEIDETGAAGMEAAQAKCIGETE
jgi:hypothetical protein